MKKWTLLDQVTTEDGNLISLLEHDGTYVIRVNNLELMSTRQHASEEQLAMLTCEKLLDPARARLLIGGLGFGFTLQAALESLPGTAEVVVCELLPAVIAWNKKPDYSLSSAALADPRVTIKCDHVGQEIARSGGNKELRYDAILLDVDNGPNAMTTGSNAALYQTQGLQQVKAALKPGGIAAYWSARPDTDFEKLLKKVGFRVETKRVRAHTSSGSMHTLFFAQKSGV